MDCLVASLDRFFVHLSPTSTMGARQRANHRSKPARGSAKGSPVSQKQSSSLLQVPTLEPSLRHRALLSGWQNFSESSSPPSRNDFSMSQEARNTEKHVFGWSSSRLRDSAVAFVSAGLLGQDERENSQHHNDVGLEDTSLHIPEVEQTLLDIVDEQEPQTNELVAVVGPPESPLHDDGEPEEQIEETAGRLRLSSMSSSASDQVVFSGRTATTKKSTMPPVTSSQGITREASPIAVAEPQPNPSEDLQPNLSANAPMFRSKAHKAKSVGPQRRTVNPRHRRRYRTDQAIQSSGDDEAIMEDYIANMAVDDDNDEENLATTQDVGKTFRRRNEHFRFFDGAGEENAKVQIISNSPQYTKANLDQAADWSSGDLSTTDEDIQEVSQVLRRRSRPSGLQYLVTVVGHSANDAKWVLYQNLTTTSAREEVRIFEEIQSIPIEKYSGDVSVSDSEDNEGLNDLLDEFESEDAENERILKQTARMSDEQIAQTLAKQEYLGLGADELLLFDGNAANDHHQIEFEQGQDYIPFSAKKHMSNRTRSKKNKRQSDQFPSAEAFADILDDDPYGGFDVMDFDRPSLRPRRKGRKSNPLLEYELEDDELAQQLLNTWNKDREKKASRKREKQEIHEAALLESSERNDPAVIKAEIRQFLVHEQDTLKLAPMDSATRASVHRLAKVLKLNSRSEGKEGKGIGRFPVLTKTAHTPSYTIDTVWEVDALLNTRKFFPKNSSSYKHTVTKVNQPRGGGGVAAGATLRNGEIVGASAPEIGAGNKGRAMLEKMGWSKGMAIGADGNKGNLEFVQHVVKTTKAGLG